MNVYRLFPALTTPCRILPRSLPDADLTAGEEGGRMRPTRGHHVQPRRGHHVQPRADTTCSCGADTTCSRGRDTVVAPSYLYGAKRNEL